MKMNTLGKNMVKPFQEADEKQTFHFISGKHLIKTAHTMEKEVQLKVLQ